MGKLLQSAGVQFASTLALMLFFSQAASPEKTTAEPEVSGLVTLSPEEFAEVILDEELSAAIDESTKAEAKLAVVRGPTPKTFWSSKVGPVLAGKGAAGRAEGLAIQ